MVAMRMRDDDVTDAFVWLQRGQDGIDMGLINGAGIGDSLPVPII